MPLLILSVIWGILSPPRHPNCRCVYIPVVSDEFGDNELNELTGSVRICGGFPPNISTHTSKYSIRILCRLKPISGIFSDDVTLKDYTAKKGSIQAKKDYFEAKLKTTTGDEYDKFAGLLSSLDDFEEKGLG